MPRSPHHDDTNRDPASRGDARPVRREELTGEELPGEELPRAGHRVAARTRALALAVLLFGVLAAGVGIAMPVVQLTQDGASVAIAVADTDAVLSADPELLPEDTSLELARTDAARLVADELPAGLRALSRVPQMISGLLLLAGAWLVRRMLLDIAAGRPFTTRMPGRLRGLSLLVLAGTLFPPAFEGLAATAVVTSVGGLPDGSPVATPLFTAVSVLPLLVAAVLAVTAQVFESGRRLSVDLEGLV